MITIIGDYNRTDETVFVEVHFVDADHTVVPISAAYGMTMVYTVITS